MRAFEESSSRFLWEGLSRPSIAVKMPGDLVVGPTGGGGIDGFGTHLNFKKWKIGVTDSFDLNNNNNK